MSWLQIQMRIVYGKSINIQLITVTLKHEVIMWTIILCNIIYVDESHTIMTNLNKLRIK